jgi:uncharacterized membrane protein
MVDRGDDERSNGTDDTARAGDVTEQRSDVIVPLAIYKRVTVVSTVLASVLVVVGFLLLDAATKQTRLLRAPIETVLQWVGLGVSTGSLSVFLGIAGLAVIAAGATIYVFGARFRTAGMGSDKTDADTIDDNG